MFWLVVGYLFLFIFRPFEYWPVLGVIHLERIYMIFLLVAVLNWPKKRYTQHPINMFVILFLFTMILSTAFSLNVSDSFTVTFNYFKFIVFYFIILMTIQDEDQLRNFLLAYVFIMFLYVGKSAWEFFIHDRFVYRMGIKRMCGIDSTYSDPNAFAASIIYSLPFLWAMIKTKYENQWIKWGLWGYGVLALTAIIYTGSRGGMVSFLLLLIMVWLKTSRKAASIILIFFMLFFVWSIMPQKYQLRFETIFVKNINKSADASAEGRRYTLERGFDMFKKRPLFGVGPGNFSRGLELFGDYSGLSSHNLYGLLIGELGLMGVLAFILLIYKITATHLGIIFQTRSSDADKNNFYNIVSVASVQTIILLLFNGNFGGNLLRYNWLWVGAIGVLLVHFMSEIEESEGEPIGFMEIDY